MCEDLEALFSAQLDFTQYLGGRTSEAKLGARYRRSKDLGEMGSDFCTTRLICLERKLERNHVGALIGPQSPT